jgi:riboflavin kinase/FMN adenylyltransferase
MQVLSSSSDTFSDFQSPVLTVGSFDGVHLAHRAILQELTRRAKEVGGTSVVVTFEPHPQALLDPETAPLLLTTTREKLEIFESLELDVAYLLPFTWNLAKMEAEVFVKKILHEKLRADHVVIGHDHAFGQGRRGKLQTLRELGRRWKFTVTALEPILFDGSPIGSTRIRKCLLAGKVKEAAEMLGSPYQLTGNVISGDGRGRNLDYPTANLELPSRKLIPGNGVYAVTWPQVGPPRRGLLNVGRRPTFDGRERSVEIHFLDFKGSLYGKEISIQIIDKIRDEIKFPNGVELKQQIKKDEQLARRLLAPD